MEGLASYGSDDDYEESPQRNPEPEEGHGSSSKEKPARDNYEDVVMDLSENENGDTTTESKSSKSLTASPSHTPPKSGRRATRDEEERHSPSSRRHRDKRERDRRRRSRTSSASRSRSRSPPRRNQSRRKDDKHDKRDRYRKERDSRHRSGHSKHRSRSRDAPRRHHRDHRERDDGAPRDRHSKRFERASNKLAHLEKMGIDVSRSQDKRFEANCAANPPAATATAAVAAASSLTGGSGGEDRLLPPGVTGRLREQMERRKALWQKKPDDVQQDCERPRAHAPAHASGKVWQGTTFAHDQEGKQANKFKRLMGIREAPLSAADTSTASLAKQQEELFSSMEQQYEVARTATHTMRGVGLGFGSYQR